MGNHFKNKISATGSILCVQIGILAAMLGGLHPFLAAAHGQSVPTPASSPAPTTGPTQPAGDTTLGPGTLVPIGIVCTGMLVATTAAYKIGGMMAKMKRDNHMEIRAINRLNAKVFGEEAAKVFELEEDP